VSKLKGARLLILTAVIGLLSSSCVNFLVDTTITVNVSRDGKQLLGGDLGQLCVYVKIANGRIDEYSTCARIVAYAPGFATVKVRQLFQDIGKYATVSNVEISHSFQGKLTTIDIEAQGISKLKIFRSIMASEHFDEKLALTVPNAPAGEITEATAKAVNAAMATQDHSAADRVLRDYIVWKQGQLNPNEAAYLATLADDAARGDLLYLYIGYLFDSKSPLLTKDVIVYFENLAVLYGDRTDEVYGKPDEVTRGNIARFVDQLTKDHQ
jgi:hypothetical protein